MRGIVRIATLSASILCLNDDKQTSFKEETVITSVEVLLQ